MMLARLLRLLLLIPLLFQPFSSAIKCYSCANDFIQWRHFFLKRNYGLTASDKECTRRDYDSTDLQGCRTSCFIFYLNATDKRSGATKTLGVGRGCSSSFLTDEQHLHLGFGGHSKLSQVGDRLPTEFDKYDIYEHWCFCATDKCNKETCYSHPYGSYDYPGQYVARRGSYPYQSYWGNGIAAAKGFRTHGKTK
ncbi:unnamed protein product, partial [Mesorhabditis spiculigera]